MFNEIHPYDGKTLAFIQSININAFPCGRRSSANSYDKNGNSTIDDDEKFYFPFDPEARLNTEANNRRHSSLNGFTQTYLKEWDSTNKLLTVSLAGYLFNISLTGKSRSIVDGAVIEPEFDYSLPKNFGEKLIEYLAKKYPSANDATRIYANILLEDVHLFSSSAGTNEGYECFTSILRDQYDSTNITVATNDAAPETLLDLLNRSTADGELNLNERKHPKNYYFSGLSFSTTPLTGNTTDTRSSASQTVSRVDISRNITTSHKQLIVSLCILEKVTKQITTEVDGEETTATVQEWQIHQPAYLPKIEHSTTEDSIVVYGDTLLHSNLYVDDNINVGNPTTPAAVNNGGYIVAEKDITAEQHLKAKKNLYVEEDAEINGDATVETSLVVGVRDDADSTEAGVITAKNHIETPSLNVSDNLTAEKATIKELYVQVTDGTGTLTADTIEVPYTGAADGDTTTIDVDGISAPYVYANLINADGIAVNDNIGITDPTDRTKVITSVGANIKTEGDITADGTIEAPTIKATEQADIKTANISSVLNVHTDGDEAAGIQANSAVANIDNATVTEILAVRKDAKLSVSNRDPSKALLDVEVAAIDDAAINKAVLIDSTKIIGTLTVEVDTADKATINKATITNSLNVISNTDGVTAKVTADTAEVLTDLTVGDDIYVGAAPDSNEDYSIGGYPQTHISGGRVTTGSIDAKFAVDTPRLTAAGARIGTLNGDDIQQKIGEGDSAKYYDVPVMFIEKDDDDKYQLRFFRVNTPDD